MITRENLDRLRCEIVCGAANNVLAEDSLAADLDARGILYAPDFIVNSGGLISVYSELNSLPRERTEELVDRIGEVLGTILAEADSRGMPPLSAAHELARERLAEGSRLRGACLTLDRRLRLSPESGLLQALDRRAELGAGSLQACGGPFGIGAASQFRAAVLELQADELERIRSPPTSQIASTPRSLRSTGSTR